MSRALAIVHCVLLSQLITSSFSQDQFPIGEGWARTKVNCVIFRKSALCTHQNLQYAAYYDAKGRVILARWDLNGVAWMTHTTQYTGNVADAHNCISLAMDGEGSVIEWHPPTGQ